MTCKGNFDYILKKFRVEKITVGFSDSNIVNKICAYKNIPDSVIILWLF